MNAHPKPAVYPPSQPSPKRKTISDTPLPWKVGELARRTGLSVRALHHYDAIGLVSPSLRSAAGHRLYDGGDVARLQQVQSLRAMGISLDEIKRFLEDREVSPLRVIYLHLARLREHMTLQRRLAARLQGVAQHLESAGSVSADELCQLIEGMTMMEQYFTTEQLEEIRQRGEQVGAQRMRDVGAEWAEIIPAVRTEMERGTDPASPVVQALAKRWKELVHEFTGGNPGISKSLTNMYKAEGPALQEKLGHVPDAAMFEYISRAFAAGK
ncbi:MAG: MerR family transcriptional regulator [Acidobacteriota bacterium]